MKRNQSSIKHRKPGFVFDTSIPRHWLGGSAFKTHLLNSFTLIFPCGERFFIRSVKRCLAKVASPETRAEAMAFIKQEAQHALEHQRFFKILEQQGYNPERIHRLIESLVARVLEPLNGEQFNLALTAGFEHITALLAEISLEREFLAPAPEELRNLYDWHAAEEIEHRNVAFDVYNEVSGHYFLRILGLFYAYCILGALSSTITAYLLARDGELLSLKTMRDALDMMLVKEKLFFRGISIFARYLDPGFHPSKENVDSLAEQVFGSSQWATA
jgi:hypothetical protein